MAWICAAKKTTGCGQGLSVAGKRLSSDHSRLSQHLQSAIAPQRDALTCGLPCKGQPPASARCISSAPAARVKKQALDREVIVSVLEAAATRRDAKGYLQKYTSKNPKHMADVVPFVQCQKELQEVPHAKEPVHIAILTLRVPQNIDQTTLDGVAKTLSQLKVLGLLSVVVVDCGIDESRQTFEDQSLRLCESIDAFGKPGAKVASNVFAQLSETNEPSPHILCGGMRVEDQGLLTKSLHHGIIPVIPSLASRDEVSTPQPVEARKTVLGLTKYFTGVQFQHPGDNSSSPDARPPSPQRVASVERIIVLDPLGGTPVPGRPGVCQRFINLEQEYEPLLKQLMGPEGSPLADDKPELVLAASTHAVNLGLVKDALSMLPSTSSALITTPAAAANTRLAVPNSVPASAGHSPFAFNGMVTTRRRQNPLLHNLLTDKPVFSSSLPFQRLQDDDSSSPQTGDAAAATLVKRGMPVTIYPDPRTHPWRQPKPGSPRLRLTDNCIDLPRLTHLIEDSFNRKLDVEDYLNRVNENLAGVIIAGAYEGGAILTWERPDDGEDGDGSRLVPYLDKFAVLKSRQGSGGVADILFNAMVQDCFPEGVCWRSRKDNPVNKWYFERSLGASKLPDSNWTMFWTTPGLDSHHPTMRDYEAVCRGVQPSWADNKHILD